MQILEEKDNIIATLIHSAQVQKAFYECERSGMLKEQESIN
jgi:hypothetical protein